MRVITTHLSADFDAFAAAVCAGRLFAGHRVLFPGSQEVAVRRFLAAVEVEFPEVRLREARRERWEHAVVVDTRTPARLGEAWELILRDRCPVTLIDHHTAEVEALGAAEVHCREVGATCTVLQQMFAERGVAPTEVEASLMLMGIYEDTGGLSFRETTPEDLRAAAWLLEHGGSLEWVRRWVLKGLEPEQLELLNRLVEGTTEVEINGVPVAIASLEVDRYLEEAAYVVHRWVETFDHPVGAAILVQPPNVNVILRSRVPGLHVGEVAERFGGGGHPAAASARITGMTGVEVRERLLAALAEAMPPPVTARDLALPRIFTVPAFFTVEQAKERMNHLRVNALPVEDPVGGTLRGTVTRQVLDQAISHGLGGRLVTSVMLPEVPTVPGDTPVEALRDRFLETSCRFVVVEDGGQPVGIVTRMELFRRLFEQQRLAGSSLDNRIRGARHVTQPVTGLLREVAPAWVQEVLERARQVAAGRGEPVYMVGGVVRDLLLRRPNEDVDLVVEGDGIAFARELAEAAGGTCHPHEPFMTAVIVLPEGRRVDVASARTEFYRTPAALPEVETSLIRQDLYRRDFTINALAIVLSGDRFGTLVDFFGGRKDLDRREIRVLHSLSFIDDPTRAIRAVRYARRLDFTITADTRHLIATALAEGVFDRLSGQRLRHELELLLDEPHPAAALALLAELGLLDAIVPGVAWSAELEGFLLELEGITRWYEVERLGALPRPWVLYLGAVALERGPEAPAALARRLALAGGARRRFAAVPGEVSRLLEAVGDGARLSELVRAVERAQRTSVLLAMARLDLGPRRRLGEALEAAVRHVLPVRGADLVRLGVPQGPWIGAALERVRDALLDGEIAEAGALDLARTEARRLQREMQR